MSSPPPPEISLSWSAVFNVAPKSNKSLAGDKILLPQSALEQLLSASTVINTTSTRPNLEFDPFNPYSLAAARAEQSEWHDAQQQLPHPLTFRLVNQKNGNIVHAGIREFSAEEGEVVLSQFLLEALGIIPPAERKRKIDVMQTDEDNVGTSEAPIDLTEDDETVEEEEAPIITVHAKQLPKGTYVRLRPLEAGYDPEDWKSLLEKHMRENFTTLTNGEILTVRGGKSKEFRFLIDNFKPEGDGICVVDTDLEVDIEALNEEQARETLKQIMAKSQKAPGTAQGSSVGGDLNIWKPISGQALEGDYIDYQLSSWDRVRVLEIELDGEGVELFVSPFSPRQRARPRDDEHVWGEFGSSNPKKVSIQPTNVELENVDAIYITIYARPSGHSGPHQFKLRSGASAGLSEKHAITLDGEDTEMHGPDEEQCKNCTQWVPKRTMMLHENFCLRNNILCPQCKQVFQKKSQDWNEHWHCPHDSEHGNDQLTKTQHDDIHHTSRHCPGCSYKAKNLHDLALHRTSICPAKMILCQFCHLEVPQEGDPFDPSPEALISGLTAHELQDGTRTTECHLCGKFIQLRNMNTHLKHHDLEKAAKSKPEICRNVNCGRTLYGVGKNGEVGAGLRMGQGPGNDLGLCSICFGPLYVNTYDPTGKMMTRRVERRYLQQLLTGCGKAWCKNELYCKTGKAKAGNKEVMTAQIALPIIKPLMEMTLNKAEPMFFCVDEVTQKWRGLAEMVAAERIYDLEWCVAAFEAEKGNLDRARTWLSNWAPRR